MTNANLLYGSLIRAQRASRARRIEDELADRLDGGRPRTGVTRPRPAPGGADA